ncbi:hypothetical protein BDV97DRAFT_224672 [Delphinella strobiligena]|nr:hypothetical protein BDV97DRAFT_224672 [Delphinella strobiligena]
MPLTIKPPKRPSTSVQSLSEPVSPSTVDTFGEGRERSPQAPPASPLTPVLRAAYPTTAAQIAHTSEDPVAHVITTQARSGLPASSQQNGKSSMAPVQLIDRPPPLPFSGEDSTDAIALRAAISSLQFQRQRAQKDLKTLEEIKRQAVERPEDFRQHVLLSASTKATTTSKPGAKWTSPLGNDDSESDEDTTAGAGNDKHRSSAEPRVSFGPKEVLASQQSPLKSAGPSLVSTPVSRGRTAQPQSFDFPPVPTPQDVVRCPPIEWAKYHVLGETLDKLHEEQQLRPGIGGSEGRESLVAGPYNPFVDRLDSEDRATKHQSQGTRKDSGASAAEAGQRRRSSKALSQAA